MFNFFKKENKDNKTVEIMSPVVGKCFNITEIPDEAFSSKMLGEGVGFESSEGVLYAPIYGEVLQIFPTKHALVIKTEEGLEILLHIGIETVNMKGEGFEAFVKKGDVVKTGDKLVTFDPQLIKKKAKSTIGPIVITNTNMIESVKFTYGNVDKNTVVAKINLK